MDQWGTHFHRNRCVAVQNNLLCISWHKGKHQSSPSLTLREGNSPVTSCFSSQRANNAENVSMLWCHNKAKWYFISRSRDISLDLVGHFERCHVISQYLIEITDTQLNLVHIWRQLCAYWWLSSLYAKTSLDAVLTEFAAPVYAVPDQQLKRSYFRCFSLTWKGQYMISKISNSIAKYVAIFVVIVKMRSAPRWQW